MRRYRWVIETREGEPGARWHCVRLPHYPCKGYYNLMQGWTAFARAYRLRYPKGYPSRFYVSGFRSRFLRIWFTQDKEAAPGRVTVMRHKDLGSFWTFIGYCRPKRSFWVRDTYQPFP